jgi:antitoxin HicB
MKVNFKFLDYYLSLKYPISFYPESEGDYTVTIKDIPGCISQGETLSEAMENIECEDEIPLPATEVEYSGSLSLQIPKSLHLSLAEKAEREGVSLDQYILVTVLLDL